MGLRHCFAEVFLAKKSPKTAHKNLVENKLKLRWRGNVRDFVFFLHRKQRKYSTTENLMGTSKSVPQNRINRYRKISRLSMTLWNASYELPIAIFGITQKHLWIKTSKMVRWWITKRKKTSKYLATRKETGN